MCIICIYSIISKQMKYPRISHIPLQQKVLFSLPPQVFNITCVYSEIKAKKYLKIKIEGNHETSENVFIV